MLVSAPSLVISLFAAGLSVTTFIYNRSKDARARRQSIQDDFWLRKVVSPNSIEPFLKFTTELRISLPQATGTDTSISIADVTKFWTACTTRMGEFNAAFQLLDLVNPNLTPHVTNHIDTIEDELATYCGTLIAALQTPGTASPSKPDCLNRIASAQKAIFELIHQHQSALGQTGATSAWRSRLLAWWHAPRPPKT